MLWRFTVVLIPILCVVGCSSMSQRNPSSEIERGPAGLAEIRETLSTGSVLARMNGILQIAQRARGSMPLSENPRHLLVQQFISDLSSEIQRLEKNPNLAGVLRERSYLPAAPPRSDSNFSRVAEVYDGFANVVASFETMNKIGIFFNIKTRPIIVEPDSPETLEILEILDREMGQFQAMIQSAPDLVSPDSRTSRRRASEMNYASNLAQSIHSSLPAVFSNARVRKPLESYMLKLTNLSGKMSGEQIVTSVATINRNADWKATLRRLRNVSLPSSSEVEGSQDSFERALTVSVGADMLNFLFINVQ